MTAPLVEIRNLSIAFPRDGAENLVVRGLDLTIRRGESVALVGESGSGKSVTARSLIGLTGPGARVTADRFAIEGQDVLRFRDRDWRRLRGRGIGFVLQDALVSLDPLRRIGQQISDASGRPRFFRRRLAWEDSLALLRSVGIRDPERRLTQYPHQLSGGLRQRALIATAIARAPALVVADEPTTALDATVQKQILDLLAERSRAGNTLLLISHDLAVVSNLADRILVMKDGQVVEQGATAEILSAPAHPYTRRLLDAIPSAATRGSRLTSSDDPLPATARAPLPPKRIEAGRTVLRAERLVKHYGRGGTALTVVNDVSFDLAAGEALGIVGESGSGKTTVARMVLGLAEPDAGHVLLDGQPWSGLTEARRRPLRAGIQLIAQDALSSFDPRYDVGRIVGESLGSVGVHGTERRRRVLEVLDAVRLGPAFLHRNPRELSGGQRQRVAIARAAPTPAGRGRAG